MAEEQPNAGDYRSRAGQMLRLARQTRYPDVRARLLSLAAGFERLADQVEKWESGRFATAAD